MGLHLLSFAGAFVVQSNTIEVGPSDNYASANSGYNLQASGSQLNGNLQVAGAGAGGGWAGSVGLLGLAVAFGGDAEATAANVADSGNSQTVSNSLVTGDATAQNFTGVVATQTNMNEGNAGALDGLALIGIAIGGIVQYNGAYVEADDNYAGGIDWLQRPDRRLPGQRHHPGRWRDRRRWMGWRARALSPWRVQATQLQRLRTLPAARTTAR